MTAGVALFAIALLSARRRAAYRNLPAHLRDAYERGKCFGVLPNVGVRLAAHVHADGGRDVADDARGHRVFTGRSLGLDSRRRAGRVAGAHGATFVRGDPTLRRRRSPGATSKSGRRVGGIEGAAVECAAADFSRASGNSCAVATNCLGDFGCSSFRRIPLAR